MKKWLLAAMTAVLVFSLCLVGCGTQWQVSFDLDGGTVDGASTIEAIMADEGSTIALPTPEKEGYRFDGWFTDAAHTQPFTATSTVTGEITLYALWTPLDIAVTVVFGELGTETVNCAYNSQLSLAELAARQPDYECLGWSDGTNTYGPDDVITVTEAITLTGTFEAKVFDFALNSDGESYSVTALVDTSLAEVTVPDTYRDLPVTEIQYRAFYNCTAMISITLPDTIVNISTQAFSGCANLESIELPEGLRYIGNRAFTDCYALTEFTIPESVTSIGSEILAYTHLRMASLEDLTLPYCGPNRANATESLSYLFGGIAPGSLKSVKLAYAVSIPMGFMSSNAMTDPVSSIESIDVPFLGETAENGAEMSWLFGDPDNPLISAVLPTTLKEITVRGGQIVDYCFNDNPSLQTVTLENVTALGIYALANCDDLTTINLPEGLLTIGNYAFYGTPNWSIVLPSTVTSIGDRAFSSTVTETFVLPTALETVNGFSFMEIENLQSYVISDDAPNFMTEDGVLYDKARTTLVAFPIGKASSELILPSTVTEIGRHAFYDNKGVTKVDFSNIERIGMYAFYNGGLTEAMLEKTESLGDYAFGYNADMTVAKLPASLEQLGDSLFQNCTRLEQVITEEGETPLTLGTGIFRNCSALSAITLPATWTEIPNFTFWGCNALAEVTIEGTLVNVGINAFAETALSEITLPMADQSYIGSNVFQTCPNLRYIYFINENAPMLYNRDSGMSDSTSPFPMSAFLIVPEGAIDNYLTVDNWSDYAGNLFDSAVSSEEDFVVNSEGVLMAYNGNSPQVILPDTVKSIGEYVFRDHDEIVSVTLNEGLTAIGNGAFQNCIGIRELVFPSTLTTIGANGTNVTDPFAGCSGLMTVTFQSRPTFMKSFYDFDGACPVVFATAELIEALQKATADSMFAMNTTNNIFIDVAEKDSYVIGENTILSADGTVLVKFASGTLTSFTVPDTVTEIGANAFRGNVSLTGVDLGRVQTIGRGAFYGTGLTSIDLPGTLTWIDSNAFSEAAVSGTLTVPASVTWIGSYAFQGTHISALVIQDAPVYIWGSAFRDILELNAIDLGNETRYLGDEVFSFEDYQDYDKQEIEIILPASIIAISEYAFDYSEYFTAVYCRFTEEYAQDLYWQIQNEGTDYEVEWSEYWVDYIYCDLVFGYTGE